MGGIKWKKVEVMFRGKFVHSLDEKGRFSLPAKFRDFLRTSYGSETLVITNFPECLVAYPLGEWKKIEDALLSIPFGHREGREFLRYFLGSAEEVEPDKQGRILLPHRLRNQIKAEGEIVLLGMLTYFEIWNPQHLEERFNRIRDNFDSILAMIQPYFSCERN